MDNLLEKIKTDYLASYLHIPNTTARLFDRSLLSKFKTSEEKIGEEDEKNDLMEGKTIDSIISSTSESENEIMDKLSKQNKSPKIAVDLFNGKNAEHLLTNRVDRDVFDLIYHSNFKYNIEFDLYKLNKIVFSSGEDFKHFQQYYEELYKVEQFCNSVSINLKGEYDFIINSVKKKDIQEILSDKSKQFFVFGDKNLFQQDNYDFFGEVTINLFNPSNYLHKLKQIIKYIIIIKLYENHPNYFEKIGIKKKK